MGRWYWFFSVFSCMLSVFPYDIRTSSPYFQRLGSNRPTALTADLMRETKIGRTLLGCQRFGSKGVVGASVRANIHGEPGHVSA